MRPATAAYPLNDMPKHKLCAKLTAIADALIEQGIAPAGGKGNEFEFHMPLAWLDSFIDGLADAVDQTILVRRKGIERACVGIHAPVDGKVAADMLTWDEAKNDWKKAHVSVVMPTHALGQFIRTMLTPPT